jgi:glycine/D-amino acid oxidase-like deaminating enzyme
MQTTARVVVIGGGVVGVSTLYHLAKMGWSDAVLLERKELTSGSTWHAAGLLPLFNLSYSVGKLHQYSVGLYPSLEAGIHCPQACSPIKHGAAICTGIMHIFRRRKHARRRFEGPVRGEGHPEGG